MSTQMVTILVLLAIVHGYRYYSIAGYMPVSPDHYINCKI